SSDLDCSFANLQVGTLHHGPADGPVPGVPVDRAGGQLGPGAGGHLLAVGVGCPGADLGPVPALVPARLVVAAPGAPVSVVNLQHIDYRHACLGGHGVAVGV